MLSQTNTPPGAEAQQAERTACGTAQWAHAQPAVPPGVLWAEQQHDAAAVSSASSGQESQVATGMLQAQAATGALCPGPFPVLQDIDWTTSVRLPDIFTNLDPGWYDQPLDANHKAWHPICFWRLCSMARRHLTCTGCLLQTGLCRLFMDQAARFVTADTPYGPSSENPESPQVPKLSVKKEMPPPARPPQQAHAPAELLQQLQRQTATVAAPPRPTAPQVAAGGLASAGLFGQFACASDGARSSGGAASSPTGPLTTPAVWPLDCASSGPSGMPSGAAAAAQSSPAVVKPSPPAAAARVAAADMRQCNVEVQLASEQAIEVHAQFRFYSVPVQEALSRWGSVFTIFVVTPVSHRSSAQPRAPYRHFFACVASDQARPQLLRPRPKRRCGRCRGCCGICLSMLILTTLGDGGPCRVEGAAVIRDSRAWRFPATSYAQVCAVCDDAHA